MAPRCAKARQSSTVKRIIVHRRGMNKVACLFFPPSSFRVCGRERKSRNTVFFAILPAFLRCACRGERCVRTAALLLSGLRISVDCALYIYPRIHTTHTLSLTGLSLTPLSDTLVSSSHASHASHGLSLTARSAAHRGAAHGAVPPRERGPPPCTGGPWARLPSRPRPSSAARVW